MTERQLQDAIVEMARLLGWLAYHTFDSRHSAAGFPDLVLLRGHQLIFAELKSETGRLSPEQDAWIAALQDTRRVTVAVWMPHHWLSGEVERALRAHDFARDLEDDLSSAQFSRLTEAVRAADRAHESAGGGTRHWIRECFLPELEVRGLQIVEAKA